MKASQATRMPDPPSMRQRSTVDRLLDRWRRTLAWLAGVFYGMFFYDALIMFRRQRADLEHLFVLISFGDLIGVPILPPYYNMRLLPYIVPLINSWRRRMLREKDLTDLIG